jgi:hypothetical protein
MRLHFSMTRGQKPYAPQLRPVKLCLFRVLPYFEILLPGKTVHEPTRNEGLFVPHFV